MSGTAGARERLEREAEAVRGCLRALAEQLTPGQVPGFALPGEPSRDAGAAPPTAHFAFSAQVHARAARPPRDAYEPDLAARAAGLLAAEGWAVEAESAVRAVRDGMRVGCSLRDDGATVLYEGRTSDVVLYEAGPGVRPEPAATARTLWGGHELCYECDGLGWCPACQGEGWVRGGSPGWGAARVARDPDRLGRCPLCHARRICPICRGAGQVPHGSDPYRRPGPA